MADFFRQLSAISQIIFPVVEQIIKVVPTDHDTETASRVEAVRKASAITESVISHISLISQELPENEDNESVPFVETVRNTVAITQSLTSDIVKILKKEDSTYQETNEHSTNEETPETINESGPVDESVISSVTKTSDVLSLQTIEQTNTKTVLQVQPTTQSVPEVERKLEECTTYRSNEPDPDDNGSSTLNFVHESIASETTLEEDVTSDLETETAPKITDIIPLNKVRDGLNHYLNGDDQSGKKVLASASREVVTSGAGAMGFTFLGDTGAAAAGVLFGAIFDLIYTDFVNNNEEKPISVWDLKDSNKPEDIKNVVDVLKSDAQMGYAGGKTLEKTARSSEIESFERVKQYRDKLGLENPVANMEVWTEVKDLKTGKIYYGVNKNIRRKVKLTEPRDPKPNIYVENFPIKEDLPIQRDAQTCAEMHAFHQMLKDQPNADVTNTQVNTFALYQDGKYTNKTRCANCMIRASCMGQVPTDVAECGWITDTPVDVSAECCEVLVRPFTWFCKEQTILPQAEYNKRIKKAISDYRQLQNKCDESKE